MKASVLKVLALLLFLTSQQSFSQVTLLSNNNSPNFGVPFNGKGLFITKADSLWVTDGSPAGTVPLVNNVSYVDTGGAAFYQSKLFFTGLNAANGAELWVTDGTPAGTVLVKDIIAGTASSTPANYIVYNNTMFFTASDGVNGVELWSSNGTAAGTTLFKDINPGAGSSFDPGTPDYTLANGILYFVANDGSHGKELWRTNGTAAGTFLAADITPGAAGTTFTSITTLGTNLIFGVTTGDFFTGSSQLWKFDGTTATMLKDFGTSSALFPPASFYLFNNKLYFSAGDLFTTGSELWSTDGTAAGTTLVKDIYPGTNGGAANSSSPLLFNAVTINNKFYFQATDNTNGSELWMSDGTTAGTQLFKDINTNSGGAASSNPIIFKNIDFSGGGFTNTLFNGKVFFSANNGVNGTELWVTDGTVAGTVMVKDIRPGSGSGIPSNSFSYVYTTSGLFFAATDSTTGIEPWLSNGTAAGTNRIADINPDTANSRPQPLFFYNNQLYFSATNGDHPTRTDLFRTNGTFTALPITLLNFSATVEGKNAVKLDWTTTSEINSSHFEIERSIDGNNFSSINRVNASGNSAIDQNYTYTDYQAGNLNSSVLYYRLKSVDKDGTFKKSQVLLVRLQGGGFQFTFAPNPVQQQLNVSVSPAGAKSVVIRIIDANGKQVYQQALPTGVNVYQQNIDVAKLKAGIYYLQVITDNTIKVEKFVKE
jgi:ELWxxDGT repeat protein